MTDLKSLTLEVCEVARKAGAYIREERSKFKLDSVERKHAHDYVSYVDKGSERLIVSALRELLPEAGFITEEGSAGHSAGEQLLWVVDPLDGTTNFIHSYAPYAVSIGLLSPSKGVQLGVVYEVCADECYYAWHEGGAWLVSANGRDEKISALHPTEAIALHVSQHALEDALLCLQLPYNSDAYKPVIYKLIDNFYGRAASVRMIGSAAMALCYVAAGRLDAYAERYIGQWDYMAGSLIVQEAGGIVTDYDGNADFTRGNSVVATNGQLQEPLLQAVKMGG
ncbi:MAG: inositol monophosphatase [Prevotella sp.]|nr:inositol monophosphatase [Prevotella sp.]